MTAFKSSLAALSLSAILMSGTALAHEHGKPTTALETAISADIRAEDTARDQFRNPAETLAFFGIKPDMAVGEYGPGGGWYTRILLPLVAEDGQYVALNADVERYMAGVDDEERIARAKAFPETFPARAAEWTGIDAEKVLAFEVDETPEEAAGTMDAVVIFRSMHGLWRRNMADDTIRHFHGLLKPGGVVGLVQHRAKADAPYDYVQGANGYLKEEQIIKLFEAEGFELVASSDVNANPADDANWDGGVWSLPPTLRHGDTDRAKYEAIGESDRMTLLFRKPE